MSGRIRVHYSVRVENQRDARVRADAIAREQTVELPRGGYPSHLDDRIVGAIESVEPGAPGQWRIIISYDPFTAGDDLPQLMNLLYGNVSLLTDIGIAEVELPEQILDGYAGPAFGLDGLRKITGVYDQPIIVGTIKPMGLSSKDLAALCSTFADAGIDIVKDDHGITNQPTAPFDDRVRLCQQAVATSNERRQGSTLYVPNVTAEPGEIERRVEYAKSAGCRAVLIAPGLTGLGAMKALTQMDVAVLAHPAGSGSFLRGSGLPAPFLYGTLFRIAGADGVIYVNAGGRFPLTEEECQAINHRAREPLGQIRASLPIAGGGVDAGRVEYWIRRYGKDVGFLVGSSLYAQADLGCAVRTLVTAVADAS
ncbi:MAG: RuBisCO large subunit C-terminal-like domain-containing protein [Gemmatimonadales bacterium]